MKRVNRHFTFAGVIMGNTVLSIGDATAIYKSRNRAEEAEGDERLHWLVLHPTVEGCQACTQADRRSHDHITDAEDLRDGVRPLEFAHIFDLAWCRELSREVW
jgi:hypothetical protein